MFCMVCDHSSQFLLEKLLRIFCMKKNHCCIWIWILSCLVSWWHFPLCLGQSTVWAPAQVHAMCTMWILMHRNWSLPSECLFGNLRYAFTEKIVPMSMWLINPAEGIRGTFSEELCIGLTSFPPSTITARWHPCCLESARSQDYPLSVCLPATTQKYTEEQHFVPPTSARQLLSSCV